MSSGASICKSITFFRFLGQEPFFCSNTLEKVCYLCVISVIIRVFVYFGHNVDFSSSLRAESAPIHAVRRGISPALSHVSDHAHSPGFSPIPSDPLNPVSAAISALTHAHSSVVGCSSDSRSSVSPAAIDAFSQLLARTPTPPSVSHSPHRAFSRNSEVSVQSLINSTSGLISPPSILDEPHHPLGQHIEPTPRSVTMSASHSESMSDEAPRSTSTGSGSISPMSSGSGGSYAPGQDVTIAAVVIFHNLRSLRKSPRTFSPATVAVFVGYSENRFEQADISRC